MSMKWGFPPPFLLPGPRGEVVGDQTKILLDYWPLQRPRWRIAVEGIVGKSSISLSIALLAMAVALARYCLMA